MNLYLKRMLPYPEISKQIFWKRVNGYYGKRPDRLEYLRVLVPSFKRKHWVQARPVDGSCLKLRLFMINISDDTTESSSFSHTPRRGPHPMNARARDCVYPMSNLNRFFYSFFFSFRAVFFLLSFSFSFYTVLKVNFFVCERKKA